MVKVIFYSYLKDLYGRTVEVQHEPGLTVGDIVERIGISRQKALTVLLEKQALGRQAMDVEVEPDSTIHILPPAGGG